MDFNDRKNNNNSKTVNNKEFDREFERDEFADPQFIDPDAQLPRIQPLRGTGDGKLCGYFISIEEMAKAGWLDYDENQLVDYIYESSGNTDRGIMIANPRMLVCPKSPLLAYDREKTQEEEQLQIIGTYQRSYREDPNISNIQFYEVILLDDNNQPLHQVPLSYVAKGANGASFGTLWQKFITEINVFHALKNRIAARPKDNRFKSLCVFSFKTKRELVGNNKQKSFACRVVDYDRATLENWKDYFVGFDRDLKELTWDNLQPTAPLITPGDRNPKLLAASSAPVASENEPRKVAVEPQKVRSSEQKTVSQENLEALPF